MKKSFTVRYDYGDSVFLKCDPMVKRVVSAYVLRPDCKPMYLLRLGDDETGYYESDIEDSVKVYKPFKVKGFK